MNGKGDSPRNCFSEAYRNNHDHIFACKSQKTKKTNSSDAQPSRLCSHTKTHADAHSPSTRQCSLAKPSLT